MSKINMVSMLRIRSFFYFLLINFFITQFGFCAYAEDDANNKGMSYKQYKESIQKGRTINNDDKTKVFIEEFSSDSDDTEKISPFPISWFKNPLFFLTESIGSRNYAVSSGLCDVINTSTQKVNCVLYDVGNFADMEPYFKKGIHSDNYEETGVDGEFAVLRQDIVHALQKDHAFFSDHVPLDVVAYLNGTYLLVFASISKNIFTVEQAMAKAKKDKKMVQIGYFDERSKNIFQTYMQSAFPEHKIIYTKQKLNKDTVCYDNSMIDFYIHLEDGASSGFKKITNLCSKYIVPLTFSDDTLNKVLKDNPYIAMANVSAYFDLSSRFNFGDLYQEFAEQNKENESQALDNQINNNAKSANSDTKEKNEDLVYRQVNPKMSFLSRINKMKHDKLNNNKKSGLIKEDDISKLPGKRGALDTNFINTLANSSILSENLIKNRNYNVTELPIKTFGIRNVLVATRYTKSEDVVAVLDALIKDYFDLRNNFLSPDMVNFSIKDILLGTSIDSSIYQYHHGVFAYATNSLKSSSYKTNEQNIAIKVLASNLSNHDNTVSYLIQVPSKEQFDIIYKKMQILNKRKNELRAIRIFQSDIDKVQKSLENIKSGSSVSDSIIQFGELSDVDIIKSVDEKSVKDKDEVSSLASK